MYARVGGWVGVGVGVGVYAHVRARQCACVHGIMCTLDTLICRWRGNCARLGSTSHWCLTLIPVSHPPTHTYVYAYSTYCILIQCTYVDAQTQLCIFLFIESKAPRTKSLHPFLPFMQQTGRHWRGGPLSASKLGTWTEHSRTSVMPLR